MQALVHLKPLILKPCRCHLKLGICIKASDAAVLWDHEHTTDKTVKVFIFGAKEWCRSIFDSRKIFVASRDLFVIDPLNLFTHKSYRRGRIRMQYELYIFRACNYLQYIFQIETLIQQFPVTRIVTSDSELVLDSIFRLSCTLLEDLTLHISKISLIQMSCLESFSLFPHGIDVYDTFEQYQQTKL